MQKVKGEVKTDRSVEGCMKINKDNKRLTEGAEDRKE